MSDFTRSVTLPFIAGVADSVDKYLLNQMQVFRQNLSGSIGSRPSTMAHIAGATQTLNDNKVVGRRVALIDSTVENSFSQLAQFTSEDYGSDGPSGLREARLGRRYGFDFVTDTNLAAFDRGDIAGTPLVDGAASAGATSITIDGFTSATGTVKAGTAFTIAGDSTRYVVRKDASIASNEATVTVTPALASAAADNAAVTVEAAGYGNLVYTPNAVSAAILLLSRSTSTLL